MASGAGGVASTANVTGTGGQKPAPDTEMVYSPGVNGVVPLMPEAPGVTVVPDGPAIDQSPVKDGDKEKLYGSPGQ